MRAKPQLSAPHGQRRTDAQIRSPGRRVVSPGRQFLLAWQNAQETASGTRWTFGMSAIAGDMPGSSLPDRRYRIIGQAVKWGRFAGGALGPKRQDRKERIVSRTPILIFLLALLAGTARTQGDRLARSAIRRDRSVICPLHADGTTIVVAPLSDVTNAISSADLRNCKSG